jgi:MFS family permease
VNTLFLLDAGLSIGEVFVANAAFSLGMVLFEIPTGVVADTLGRRVSYLFSVGVLAATTVAYLLVAEAGGGVVEFSLVSVVMGLGFTFYSGALEAWLVDALGSQGGDTGLDRVFARGQQVTGAAMLVGTIAGGVLGQVDLAVPYVARGVVLVALFALAWATMHDIGFTPRELRADELVSEMTQQARAGITYGWDQTGLRYLTLAGAVRGAFLGWAFYASQPYFLELLDDDAVWVIGLTTAALSVATMFGNQIVTWATHQCGRRTTLILIGTATVAVAGAVVGLADTFWLAVAAYLVMGVALGLVSPVRQTYLHRVTPSEHRATVVSFDAMIASVGGAGGQVGLGAYSGATSLSAGYVVGGLGSLLALPLVWATRRVGGPGDHIEGDGPVEGTCAGEGLPRAVQIESQPRPEPATT